MVFPIQVQVRGTHSEVLPEVERLVGMGVHVVPIFSQTLQQVGTRFGEAGEWVQKFEAATGERGITSIPEAEPLGPSKRLDCLVIAPCTGNTLSRLANASTDSAPLMAAKSTMRNDRPVILAVSTNDGLGLNLYNIATLLNMKNIFFVPFGQDDPHGKMNSLVSLMRLIPETCAAALEKRQLQPLLVERWRESRSMVPAGESEAGTGLQVM